MTVCRHCGQELIRNQGGLKDYVKWSVPGHGRYGELHYKKSPYNYHEPMSKSFGKL